LLALQFFEDGFGNPRISGNSAGAHGANRVYRFPYLRIKAEALAGSIATGDDGFEHDSHVGAEVAPHARTFGERFTALNLIDFRTAAIALRDFPRAPE